MYTIKPWQTFPLDTNAFIILLTPNIIQAFWDLLKLVWFFENGKQIAVFKTSFVILRRTASSSSANAWQPIHQKRLSSPNKNMAGKLGLTMVSSFRNLEYMVAYDWFSFIPCISVKRFEWWARNWLLDNINIWFGFLLHIYILSIISLVPYSIGDAS